MSTEIIIIVIVVHAHLASAILRQKQNSLFAKDVSMIPFILA